MSLLVPLILLIQPFSVVWEHLIVAPGKSSEEEPKLTSTSNISDSTTTNNIHIHPTQQAQCSRSLLHHLTTYRPIKPADRIYSQPTSTEQILFDSSLFRINVCLIQPAIVTASVLAFVTDANLIGYSTTGNWNWFCIVLGVYVGTAWLLTFSLLPWVALGRAPQTWQTIHATAFESGTNIELYDDQAVPGTCYQRP